MASIGIFEKYFPTRSKTGLLEVLLRGEKWEYRASEIEKGSGVSHPRVHVVLAELVGDGVINHPNPYSVYKLNPDEFLQGLKKIYDSTPDAKPLVTYFKFGTARKILEFLLGAEELDYYARSYIAEKVNVSRSSSYRVIKYMLDEQILIERTYNGVKIYALNPEDKFLMALKSRYIHGFKGLPKTTNL